MASPEENRDFRALRGAFEDLRNRYDELSGTCRLISALVDQGPIALSLKEPGPEGRYVYVNARWEAAFAVKISDALGKTDRELWLPEIAAQLERIDALVVETGQPADAVITTERSDGAHHWLSWRFPVRNPSAELLLGGCSIERPRLPVPVEHRVFCEARPSFLGVVCGEEDRVVEANDVFLDMLGFTREDLAVGRITLEALSAPSPEPACERARREIEATGKVSLKEVELVCKDGAVVPAGIGGYVLERSPRFTWTLYVLDMAEQRRAERRFRRDEAWERLGLMAAGLAHDFNNLLVVIIGNASMAASDAAVSPKLRIYLQEVLSAAEQAATLVRQMLIFSGKARITASRVPVGDILRDLATECVPREVDLQVDIPADLPHVTGDAAQLGEALRNLVVNAVEAIGERGAVRIAASARTLDHPVTYPDAEIPPGDYVCLAVEDTGPGIDEHLLTRIFDPFFTTKFHGRGLGLAAAYGIIRRHGGGIHVESAPGRGSRFEVLLKAAPA